MTDMRITLLCNQSLPHKGQTYDTCFRRADVCHSLLPLSRQIFQPITMIGDTYPTRRQEQRMNARTIPNSHTVEDIIIVICHFLAFGWRILPILWDYRN